MLKRRTQCVVQFLPVVMPSSYTSSSAMIEAIEATMSAWYAQRRAAPPAALRPPRP
jgi:hypothetical protein